MAPEACVGSSSGHQDSDAVRQKGDERRRWEMRSDVLFLLLEKRVLLCCASFLVKSRTSQATLYRSGFLLQQSHFLADSYQRGADIFVFAVCRWR